MPVNQDGPVDHVGPEGLVGLVAPRGRLLGHAPRLLRQAGLPAGIDTPGLLRVLRLAYEAELPISVLPKRCQDDGESAIAAIIFPSVGRPPMPDEAVQISTGDRPDDDGRAHDP